MQHNQFLLGCIDHIDENTELAIVQSIMRTEILNLTPLIICKRICMGIQFGFEFSPLSIIQTIPLQLDDKILVLLIRQTCLNGFKKLMIDIIWT
jgi:hypothetical protein